MLTSLGGTARYQQWRLLAAAVMPDHVHVVVDQGAETGHPAATDGLRRFKAYASRALNAEFGRREQWWTRSGSCRAVTGERAVARAVHYVAAQAARLALNVDPAWRGVGNDRDASG